MISKAGPGALEEARKEVKVAAVEGLAGSSADYETILQFTKDRAEDVRHAAVRALGRTPILDHAQQLHSMFEGPDGTLDERDIDACVSQMNIGEG